MYEHYIMLSPLVGFWLVLVWSIKEHNTSNIQSHVKFLYIISMSSSFSSAGIERNAAQLPQGNVDISGAFSPYATRQFSLKEEDFNKLLNLTNYNVQNNANTILRVLHKVLEQKKQAQLSQSSSWNCLLCLVKGNVYMRTPSSAKKRTANVK